MSIGGARPPLGAGPVIRTGAWTDLGKGMGWAWTDLGKGMGWAWTDLDN